MNLSYWKSIVAPRETGWKEDRHNTLTKRDIESAYWYSCHVWSHFWMLLCRLVKLPAWAKIVWNRSLCAYICVFVFTFQNCITLFNIVHYVVENPKQRRGETKENNRTRFKPRFTRLLPLSTWHFATREWLIIDPTTTRHQAKRFASSSDSSSDGRDISQKILRIQCNQMGLSSVKFTTRRN